MKLVNSNVFPLPNNPHVLHLGTVIDRGHEYVAMVCVKGPNSGKTYIEELVVTSIEWSKDTFAHFKFIQDDALAEDLAGFFTQLGLLDPTRALSSEDFKIQV